MVWEWKGVFPALVTPFTADDHLDLPTFESNLQAQIAAGVDGLIIAGSLGEASVLNKAEMESLVKRAIEIAEGKLPVILNIAEGATRDATDLAKRAVQWGAGGLMLLPPMRYHSDHRETLEFFHTVGAATDLPIMLYNNPVDYKIEITLDILEALACVPNIQAIKESTRDVSNVTRMINRFGSRYRILCGVDTIALEALLMGADGWVAGLVDAFPRETVAIYRLQKSGRTDEARQLFRWFLPLLELDIHPKLVQYIKLAASHTGMGTEYVRAPRLVLVGEERARVLRLLEEELATRPQLPDYLTL